MLEFFSIFFGGFGTPKIKNHRVYLKSYFVVEIDFYMGTKVFGFRDVKSGKFLPCSNFSLKIDSHCDGKRYFLSI